MTREECQRIFDVAQRAARSGGVEHIELLLDAHATALTRFANNTIHQNVAERDRMVSVRALMGSARRGRQQISWTTHPSGASWKRRSR